MFFMRAVQRVISLVIAIAVGIMFVAIPAPATADVPSTPTNSTTGVSDDDLLRGLIYGLGPIADKLGLQVTLPSGLSQQQYMNAVEYSIHEIKSKYPDELSEALTMLRASDPVAVEKGLDKLSSVTSEYEEYKLHRDRTAYKPSTCGIAVVCVAYAAAAVHNTVAVTGLAVVVIGGAVVAGKWLWVSKKDTPSYSAIREELVADLIAVT